jgi:hypothetical protein
MLNNLKVLLVVILCSALVGGFAMRSFFPKIKETVREIEPTVHEVELLATQIAKGRIDSLQKIVDAKPKFIYKDKIIDGKTIIDTVEIYPLGYIDVTNEMEWKKEFENENRDNDLLTLTTKDSVRVSVYADTNGVPYLGYDEFYSSVEDVILIVSPEVYKVEYINRFSLFIDGGFIIDKKQILINDILTTEYNAGVTADIGIVIEEKYLIIPTMTITQDYTSYGLKFGTYLLRIGKCERTITK